MYSGKIYTSQEMKKMNTERLHRLFQAVGFEMLFNPYEERDYMRILISVAFDRLLGVIVKAAAKKGVATRIVDFVTYQNQVYPVYEQIKSRLLQWWEKNGNKNAPTPKQGRIPEFTYEQVLDMYRADAAGVDVKTIAAYYETSYMNVYQIVTGISYKWAMVGV